MFKLGSLSIADTSAFGPCRRTAALRCGKRCRRKPRARTCLFIAPASSFPSPCVQPDKIKAERSAVPQVTIEAKLGEVLCVFHNPQTKQFWTSHKASNVIVLWSSSGSKALEIKCGCFITFSPHQQLTPPRPPTSTRLELSHPVNCFCKVGHDEVWAGSFDSIIMFNNDGDRLHSTSTGAGRMIFIRQGTVPCVAPQHPRPTPSNRPPDSLFSPLSCLCSYVWSGGGVSTSDLLASSSIFKWSVTHPPSARQPFKLGTSARALR